MKMFANFMGSTVGRAVRVFAGAGLIAYGLLEMAAPNGYLLAAVGLLPILTGVFNICLIAPLLGAPLSGSKSGEAHS